jgi:hypothetical protein
MAEVLTLSTAADGVKTEADEPETETESRRLRMHRIMKLMIY